MPYAFTWNIKGGGEWRFTMHAYPFYLVAAGVMVTGLVSLARQRGLRLPSAGALAKAEGAHDSMHKQSLAR